EVLSEDDVEELSTSLKNQVKMVDGDEAQNAQQQMKQKMKEMQQQQQNQDN
ncbi:MAG: hypothetical protein GWN16_12870, partial [Calditrichae bacterium]|nr:hypothetical protein [Calditrichia bacterium]